MVLETAVGSSAVSGEVVGGARLLSSAKVYPLIASAFEILLIAFVTILLAGHRRALAGVMHQCRTATDEALADPRCKVVAALMGRAVAIMDARRGFRSKRRETAMADRGGQWK